MIDPLPDFRVTPARMRVPTSMKGMIRSPLWDAFFIDSARRIFEKGGLIVDIGGGLRIDGSRGNRVDLHRQAMLSPYLSRPDVIYRITDYTAKYRPDFIEDIHALSFRDNSIDGLFCLAVLEHVYDPKRACEEIVRVLKPGSEALLYVPFIYRYHAQLTGDYKDYFRFSADGIAYLLRDCSDLEICPVRGLFESLLRFTPLSRIVPLVWITRFLDWSTPKMRGISARQTSGYCIMVRK